ncbi:hypothetical protein WJR50_21770 [Catalinimonas sp. 4WD22]|uniref:hypothetical protein n=1 Tax=Catalinimonas locisalis TaxID=3133978 RepID=UPI003101436C
MKLLLIVILLSCFGMSICHAQDTDPQEEQIFPQQADGREKVPEMDLPEQVRDAFYASEYQGMSITKAYRLTGNALDDVLNLSEGPKPNVLYELRVANENHIDIIYYTPEGIRYDAAQKS